jgi:hypothetical protein
VLGIATILAFSPKRNGNGLKFVANVVVVIFL